MDNFAMMIITMILSISTSVIITLLNIIRRR